jgi:hypothetical protein
MSINFATRRVLLNNPFSPLDVAGCAMWLDYSDPAVLFTDAGTTRVSADAQAIYQANDKSGNNRHATQSTEAYRPLYKTNIQNGLSAAYFDGSNDVMTLVDLTLTNYTTFLVFRFLTPILSTSAIHAWDNYNIGARYGQTLYQYRNVAPAGMYYEAYANGTGAVVASGALINQTPYLVDFVRNGTALSVNKNATALTGITVGSGAFTMVGHRLGTHYYSGANQNQYGKAYACELIIYDSALSDGDQVMVRNYLNAKWSIY